MIKQTTHFLRAGLGAPGLLKRTLLFSGGAVAGAVVSVTGSYAVVSALFPRQAVPVEIAAAAAPAVSSPVSTVPAFTLASVSTDAEIAVTPLAPVPVVTPPASVTTVTPPASVTTVTPPAPAKAIATAPVEPRVANPETSGNLVFASKSAPDIVLPPLQSAPESPAPRSAAAPQQVAAPNQTPNQTPNAPRDEASLLPATLAALTAQDATTRTEATLNFAAPAARTAPRTDVVASTAPYADPALADIRPAPRPDNIPVELAAVDDHSFAETIPGIRPAPRPEVQPRPEVTLAAATRQPEAAPTSTVRTLPDIFGGRSAGTCGRKLARSMPHRSGNVPGGEAFFASLGNLSGSERDARVVKELARGNMPAFLRQLRPVTFRGKDSRGADTEIVICVTPDYLALGSDRDNVRVPLGLPAAARIAGRFDMYLPTPRMVDAIYAQADVKLSPSPMQAGPQMSSTAYLLRHDATIDGQLRGRGGLVAGQKKDVVMASRMASAPGRVAIYGWHRSGGRPIQPVSTVHGANYADYSHGIRLVSQTAYLNGRPVNLGELLGSSRYAYLLNKEGPLPGPVIRTASR